MTWPLTILHLSDLHFGPHGRFAAEDTKALAKRFHQAIEQAREELGWKESVGLCMVEDGSEMTLDALCDELGLPRLPYLEEMLPEIDLD